MLERASILDSNPLLEPQEAPFIFGERNKIHIIISKDAAPVCPGGGVHQGPWPGGRQGAVRRTKRSARDAVQKEASRCSMPTVNQRWLGGMLTNFKTIRQSIKRLNDWMKWPKRRPGPGKKVAQMLRREIDKRAELGGIREMRRCPTRFVIDVGLSKSPS